MCIFFCWCLENIHVENLASRFARANTQSISLFNHSHAKSLHSFTLKHCCAPFTCYLVYFRYSSQKKVECTTSHKHYWCILLLFKIVAVWTDVNAEWKSILLNEYAIERNIYCVRNTNYTLFLNKIGYVSAVRMSVENFIAKWFQYST